MDESGMSTGNGSVNHSMTSYYVDEIAKCRLEFEDVDERIGKLIRIRRLIGEGIASLMRRSPKQLPFDEKAFHVAKREWESKPYEKLSEDTKRLVDALPEILFGRHAKWSALDKIEGFYTSDLFEDYVYDEEGLLYPEYIFHYEVYDYEVDVYFPMLSKTREYNIDYMKYKVVVSPIGFDAPYELLAVDDDLSAVISKLKSWLEDRAKEHDLGNV